jgi:hypothetical protein
VDALTAEDDFNRGGVVAVGQDTVDVPEQVRRQIDVVSLARADIVKMRVRMQIRAEAGGAALEIHRAHEVALHQRFQAVVNRGERDAGQFGLNAGEYFVGGRVVPLLQQDVVDHLALGRRAEPAVSESA